jgi:cell division protein FtsQ
MKKIITISIWTLLVTGLIVCLGFVARREDRMTCKSLDVTVEDDQDNYFVQPEDIVKMIRERGDSIIRQPISGINVPELEAVLNSHAAIAKAEVYITIDGKFKVEIKQRKPIIRIIDKYNDSYYIDTEGRFMPLSDKYTAKVLVANGNFREPYRAHYLSTDSTMVEDLYELAKYIHADEFWKAQIEQIYVNEDKEIELVPRVGNHRIILGDVSMLDEKFRKLLIFYKQALNPTGWWNNYSVINLKFKNQVVCTKNKILNETVKH